MGLLKKVKKFFKKLGKQIKTNLKHGAKYIVPVLVSAMTGGFGSGIVKSLFGNKIAGSLANFGNNTIGKLFGGAGSNAKQITDASKLVTETLSGAENALPGFEQVANVVKNAVSPIISPVLSGASNTLPGVSNVARLVSSNPLIGAIDKGAGQLMGQLAAKGLLGAVEKTYGGSGGNGNSSVPAMATEKIKLSGELIPKGLGSGAKAIEVDPNRLADTEAISPFNPEEFKTEFKNIFGNNEDEEEDERFKTNGFNNRFSRR